MVLEVFHIKKHLIRVTCQHFKYGFLRSLVSYQSFVTLLSRMGILIGLSKVLHIGLDPANVNWLQHTLIF